MLLVVERRLKIAVRMPGREKERKRISRGGIGGERRSIFGEF